MAVNKANEFLEALVERSASLVSMNYWGDKGYPNGNNFTKAKYKGKYWLESPLRAFSLKGLQTYTNAVCINRPLRPKDDFPHLRHTNVGKLAKRCIVEKTEIDIIRHYSLNEVPGLYPGVNSRGTTWSNSFDTW